MSLNHYYIVLGESWDLYRASYYDLTVCKMSKYVPGMLSLIPKFLRRLFSIHISYKVNRIINLPFKSVWTYFFKRIVPLGGNKICFVYFGEWLLHDDMRIVESFKERFPSSSHVCFLQDIVNEVRYWPYGPQVPIENLKSRFDYVLSFDHKDCINFGLIYHPLVLSRVNVLTDNELPNSDVYFLGRAKNRLKEIIGIYEYLINQGLICDFHIVGVPEEEQVYSDSIKYNAPLDYKSNIQHILKTRCLLEIMQEGGNGFTQRTNEAVVYGKRLITNNSNIKETPFYDGRYIYQLTDNQQISQEFLDGFKEDRNVDYKFADRLSPLELISFIDQLLS